MVLQADRLVSAAPAARGTAAAVMETWRIRVVTPCRPPQCTAVLSISAADSLPPALASRHKAPGERPRPAEPPRPAAAPPAQRANGANGPAPPLPEPGSGVPVAPLAR